MSHLELEPAYEPKNYEQKQLDLWEEHQCFKADPQSKKPAYCIVIPPPNVTGALHMGHALVNTLQDVLIRYKRMNGFEALWVPGTDHAGIATQTLVEKNLIAQFGKRRHQWTRQEFLDHVWTWKTASESRILSQLKALGSSCDFSLLAFTMDKTRSKAVKLVFKKLFDQGLIYRGDYLVNWDPITQTALADDEVEYEEHSGFLYTIKYPLVGLDEFIEIATTRPETLLADTAVAVNPTDDRYKHLVGKTVTLPLTGRLIPIVADGMVDKEFGTGAVKITPAHDMNDYGVAQRLKLPMINLLNPDGTLNENGGSYQGLTPHQARIKIVEALNSLGLLVKQEPHVHRVGISYRSKAVIEPYLSKQWFVKMDPFKSILRDLVDQGHVALIPKEYQNTYDHWINNLRDWCISRQLWWGHQIPIWYRKDDPSNMVCEGVDGPPQEVQDNPSDYVQDEDVLDTWFSSALWPFSSLGWPDNTLYVNKFYPNSTLVTGHDILFFWVARMMALGTHVMQKPPFPQVFLHGLIFGKSYFTQDQGGGVTYIKGEQKERYDRGEPLPKGVKYKWEKMSKSKGNVLDPIELMDEYGTDAIRMALVMCASQSRQIDLDRRKFEEYKNFANKLWNGARFVFMNLEGLDANKLNEASHDPSLADRWILTELSKSLQTASKAVDEYFFDKAASALTDFFWNDFCAYYLELSKPILSGKKGSPGERLLKQKILISVLMQIVAALHPFIPFVTESLFGKIKQALGQFQKTTDPLLIHFAACMNSPTLAQSPYPQSTFFDLQAADEFASIIEYLHQIRELRGELQIPPSEPVTVYLENACDLIKTHLPLLEAMTKLKEVHFTKVPSSMIVGTKTIQNATISILLPQSLIFKEIERLEKDLLKTGTEIANLKIKLANSEFIAKAPPQIVAKLELSLAQYQQTQLTLQTKLNHYKASY